MTGKKGQVSVPGFLAGTAPRRGWGTIACASSSATQKGTMEVDPLKRWSRADGLEVESRWISIPRSCELDLAAEGK